MPLTKAAIARLRSLQEKKHREALGLFVVEGGKVVGELLAAGLPVLELYATPECFEGEQGLRTRFAAGPEVTMVTADEMERISHYPTPATVLAVGRLERRALPPGALARGLTLALDGIQDPGNVGTLLRIADWFAFDRVLLSPDSADLFSQKVINASMGSFARVAVHTVPLPAVLAGAGGAILGCDLVGTDVHSLRATPDAVLVVGSEGRGLSAPVRALVTQYVTIPRHGAAESLNAAVAAGIVCDHLRRATPRR